MSEWLLNTLVHDARRGNSYLARREIERLQKAYSSDPLRLEPFGFKVYSQNDEDGIIEEIFRRLNTERGVFCEIGVGNGLECNTFYLLHKGWSGSWAEGNTEQADFIRSKFAGLIGRRLDYLPVMVTPDNINGVVGLEKEIDFLSIDVDGMDIWLLDALRSRPKVICIEYNAKFPANIVRRPSYSPTYRWDGTDYMGSSLKAIWEVAAAMGYQLVGTNMTGANAFFVRRDLADDKFCSDASLEHLYNPARYWLFFDHYLNIGHPASYGPYEERF